MGNDTKNPWGGPSNDDKGHGNWNGGGGEPPDIDEMLKKAQENFRDVMPGNIGGGLTATLLILAMLGLWLSSGFYIISPGEHGVVQRFGAWERTKTTEGLAYHLPTPIEKVTKINVTSLRNMNIGFIERYNRSGDKAKQDLLEESLMLTSDRNIVDLHLIIQWDIKSAEDFIFEIEGQENTIKKVAESAIREVVGETKMFPIITTGRDSITERTKAIIQGNLDQYNSGVNIKQILIQKAEVHPDVQDAFQDVQSAKQDADNTQNVAGAYREDILPKARGEAIKMIQEAKAYEQSQVAKATGDAERFTAVYQAYLTGKDVTRERIFIETMESVLGNAQKIILDSNGGSGVVPYLPLSELTQSTTRK